MLFQAENIGAVQHVLVRIGIVGLHALDKFKLTNYDGRALYALDRVYSTAV